MEGTIKFTTDEVKAILKDVINKKLPGGTYITDVIGTGYSAELEVKITDEKPEEDPCDATAEP